MWTYFYVIFIIFLFYFLQANCTQDEFCLPVTPNTTNVANKLKNKSLMVLVRPMNGKSWPDLPKTDTVQALENVQKRSHLGTVNHNKFSHSEIQSYSALNVA